MHGDDTVTGHGPLGTLSADSFSSTATPSRFA